MLCIIGNFNFQTIDTSKQLDQLNVNRNYGSETKYLGKQSTENKFPREGYSIESEKVLLKDTPSLNQQTTRNVSHSKIGTNSLIPHSSKCYQSNSISLKQDGFRLGKEAFRQLPVAKPLICNEQSYHEPDENLYSLGHARGTISVSHPSNQVKQSNNNNAIGNLSMANNMDGSQELEDKNSKETSNDDTKGSNTNFDGKGPVGFDAAFQQISRYGGGPGPQRFGQPLGIPPRFPGFGSANGPPYSSLHSESEDIPPGTSMSENAGKDLLKDIDVFAEGQERKDDGEANLSSKKENSILQGAATDQFNDKKPPSLPSLLDIKVQLPPPKNVVNTNSNMQPSSDPTQSSIQIKSDKFHNKLGSNDVGTKEFTPTLNTSVTFGPQIRGTSNASSFGGGMLNKPYGFEKGMSNRFARPPPRPWFNRPNFIRPGNAPNIQNTYPNPRNRFAPPLPSSYGYGGVQHNTQPLNPVIYNEHTESSVPTGNGQISRPDSIATQNLQRDISLPTVPSNGHKRSFESGGDDNGAPSKKMSIHDSKENSSQKDLQPILGAHEIWHKDPEIENKDENSVYERVRKVVTPLWNMPIYVQLEKKNGACNEFLGHLKNGLVDTNQALNIWFQHQETKNKEGLYVENKQILASPVTNGYRNKCDFVIGINPETKLTTVGFLIEQSTSFVGPVGHLSHISEGMKYVALELEKYCQASEISPFDLSSGEGYWMGATIRQSKYGEIMLNVAFHPQDLSKLQIKSVKDKLRAYFTSGPGVVCRISSLFFTTRKQWESGETENIYGTMNITEEVCGKRFQISSRTFFNVNTSAAELMYNTISEMVHLNMNCSLIDICCGTGSIGLSLSDRCGQVLGIDILEEAISDANKNALSNNITNCEFMTGSVEDSLPNLWRRVAFSEAICIIDPPRAGIGPKAIQSIRKNSSISKVIYVASDPQSAVKNFLDFARAPSNSFKGEPFVPVKAAPVDLFPHTSNFCIIFLFMRIKMADLVCPDNVDIDSYLRGAGEKQNSRGGSRDPSHSQSTRNSSVFPEHSGKAEPTPDMTWRKVQPTQAAMQSREALANELSNEQIDWLDQMVQLYGTAFQRDEWIESFKAQNAEASANYLASIGQTQTHSPKLPEHLISADKIPQNAASVQNKPSDGGNYFQ